MNYSDLQSRGLLVLDIPAEDVPKVFLDKILRQVGSNFHTFFNDFVINANKEFLAKMLPTERTQYISDYAKILSLNPDGRYLRALNKEVEVLRACHAKSVSYTPFTSVPFKSRVSTKLNSPIRLSLHASDKLDLRVGANLHQLSFGDYVAHLITTGMLRIFIRYATTPEEQALLEGRADTESVAEGHLIDALDSVYDRIIHEYKAALRTAGSENHDTSNYSAYSIRGLVRRETYPDLSTVAPVMIPAVYIREPKPDSPDSVLIPPVAPFDGLLDRQQVQSILESNNRRSAERIAEVDAPVADPAIRGTIDKFRETVYSQTMTKESKVADVWAQFRSVLVAQIDALAKIYGNETDASEVAGAVERELLAVLVARGVVPSDAESSIQMNHDLVAKVRMAIEGANSNGGITKSHLRRVIGRSNMRYVDAIDEILAYLLETGKYRLESGRYLISSGNPVMDRAARRVVQGRPKKAIQGEIIRVVEGSLGIPKENKAVKIPKNAKIEED